MQIDEPGGEEKAQQRLQKQMDGLRSGHRATILDTLQSIRTDSNVSIIPGLIELLSLQEDEEIKSQIARLLNDLRIQEAAPLLAEAVIHPDHGHVSHILAAACWQNGLSYAGQADIFVRAAIEGSYQTAVESFTVLEEVAAELDNEERDNLIRMVDKGIPDAGEQKGLLLMELRKVLRQY